jgi:hypothetical protein
MTATGPETNRYKALVEHIFFDAAYGAYVPGKTDLPFAREDLERAAGALGLKLPKNLGDVIYSIRYRMPMPERVLATQPNGMEWIVEGAGRSLYRFRLVPINRILPNPNLATVKIPDATPAIIGSYTLNDEQALLAKVRYNRLIDTFLGLTAYSLQNHLRTTVKGVGQIEIDEVYVGVDRHGVQYVLPVQAKGGSDQLSVVQSKQDMACCAEKFPGLVCRSISTQFMDDDRIAMFELTVEDDQVRIVEERHYRLVTGEVPPEDLAAYRYRS